MINKWYFPIRNAADDLQHQPYETYNSNKNCYHYQRTISPCKEIKQ